MCLSIENLTQATRRPKRTVRVFKWYKWDGEEFLSPYQVEYCALKPGEIISSSRETTSLTDSEEKVRSVEVGFHGFQTLKDVLNDVYDPSFYGTCIVEMEGAPEDFVARGKFGRSNSIVFTRLKVKRCWKVCFNPNGRVRTRLGKQLWGAPPPSTRAKARLKKTPLKRQRPRAKSLQLTSIAFNVHH